MLTFLMLMMLITMVSVGNLALGFGLAIHLGHGPAKGWQVLCFWNQAAAPDPHAVDAHDATADPHAPPAEPAAHAPAHH